jgi:hypothetical protein
MLGKEEANEHTTPLSSMHQGNTIFDSDGSILSPSRLTGKYRIDYSLAFFLFYD